MAPSVKPIIVKQRKIPFFMVFPPGYIKYIDTPNHPRSSADGLSFALRASWLIVVTPGFAGETPRVWQFRESIRLQAAGTMMKKRPCHRYCTWDI
jgi:hypothetical protein